MDYDKKQIEFVGIEAGGPNKSKRHAAPLTLWIKNRNIAWCCSICKPR